jgi:hypothetical protein
MYFNTHIRARFTCFLIKRGARTGMNGARRYEYKSLIMCVCMRVAELGKRRLEILTRTRIQPQRKSIV